jgi:hypothetical protein
MAVAHSKMPMERIKYFENADEKVLLSCFRDALTIANSQKGMVWLKCGMWPRRLGHF